MKRRCKNNGSIVFENCGSESKRSCSCAQKCTKQQNSNRETSAIMNRPLIKIGVVIPARNESKHIENTINAIKNQTLQPVQIILVDDNSNDDTVEKAKNLSVHIVSFPYEHENWVIKKELSYVFNLGLECLLKEIDYVTIVGADDILPKNYFEYISQKMENENITIASGQIGNEPTTIPRGSGRLVNWKWWQSIGGKYPINYGYESWLLAKCNAQGKNSKVYPEIKSILQRPTGKNYPSKKFVHRGQAYKALGYNKRFVFARLIVMILKKRQPVEAFRMILGYLRWSVTPYEDDVRKYYRTYQDNEMRITNAKSLIQRFFKTK